MLEDGVMPGDEIRGGEGGAEIDMEGGVNGDDGNSDGGGFAEGGGEDALRLVPMLEDEEDEGEGKSRAIAKSHLVYHETVKNI